MNYHGYKFSKYFHLLTNGVMAIVKFVPLMAQVAKTHVDTFKSLQTNLKYYIPLPNNVLNLPGRTFENIRPRNVALPLVP